MLLRNLCFIPNGWRCLRAALLKVILKPLESNHNNRNVVHSLLSGSKPEDLICAFATYLMQVHVHIILMFFHDVPDKLADLFSTELVKDTVAAKDYEVKVCSSVLEVSNIGITNNNTRHTT